MLGSSTLWSPDLAYTNSLSISIVAVHGLNSHPQRCWEKDGVFWLRDFLATSLPEARIMTFGYNSNVIDDASQMRIRGHARSLLQDLRDERIVVSCPLIRCFLDVVQWLFPNAGQAMP